MALRGYTWATSPWGRDCSGGFFSVFNLQEVATVDENDDRFVLAHILIYQQQTMDIQSTI
jgi:hypothetical protein